jgi:hypothetical protein
MPRTRDMVLLGGWLFADLLLGLMMIFLISIKGGSIPLPLVSCGTSTVVGRSVEGAASPTATPVACTPTDTPTFTPTPTNCGLDKTEVDPRPYIVVGNPGALESNDPGEQFNFNVLVKGVFAAYPGKIAGLVEVFGGDPNIGAGQSLAQAAIRAMTQLTTGQVTFFNQTTLFQDFGDQRVSSGQIRLAVFFYSTSANGLCQLQP